jgi:hypothetical protein
MKLRYFPTILSVATLILGIGIAGCKSNSGQSAQSDQSGQPSQTASSQASDADQGQNPSDAGDPANTNLAPIPASYTTTGSAASSTTESASGSASGSSQVLSTTPPAGSQPAQEYAATNYNDTPETYAPQPPPVLPEYSQPPMPETGYIWTPGYWNYAAAGYYWVPGAWTAPPYEGALWTPGFWRFEGGRYGFHRGYWGRYIGFYGGVNYGFGYVGVGYQGGYWHGNEFAYNRAVNNFGSVHITNVYERTIVINRTIGVTHVSFNGGPQGIRWNPSPAEVAAYRAPHVPPMRAQLDLQVSSSTNKAQFVQVNHGRPAIFFAPKPLAADRGIHPAPLIRPVVVARPRVEEAPRPEMRPEARPEVRPEPRPEARPEARPEVRPAPQPHPEPRKEVRPEPHPPQQHHEPPRDKEHPKSK